jgi:hypothetical protein
MTMAQLARTSAFLNLAGSLLVFLSFQATSTRLVLVTSSDKSDKTAAFCIGDTALFRLSSDGHGVGLGTSCPQSENMKPAAVVNTEYPWMAKLGWFLLLFGIGLQVYSIEPSKLTNEDLRVLRKAHKILGTN